MGQWRNWGAWCAAACLASVVSGPAWGSEATTASADRGGHARPTPSDAETLLHWVLASNDHRGRPFAIVDKKSARLRVHAADGRLLGSAAALLGQAPGDVGLPGVGRYEPEQLPLAARSTPAGRFDAEPGRNLSGEAIVWIDYDARLAIHRLRPAPPAQRRMQRLASESPDDNRISLGCVVVATDFYDEVVAPSLGRQRGTVYVLPEQLPLASVFAALRGPAAEPAGSRFDEPW